MARITLFPVNSRLTHQKGIAALLLVLLTGLSATFIAMGTMAYVRGTQKSQRTVHAQTQAEINAWAGVQALTNFLGGNLNANFQTLGTLSFSRVSNNGPTLSTATYQAGCSSNTGTTATVCFDVTGTSAQSNVTLRITYQVTGAGAPPPSVSITSPMVFNGSLLVTGGGLDVTGHKDLKNITVNGDLKVTSAAESDVSGCATGDISIDGGGIASDGYLHSSGGDITITGQGDKNAAIWGENVTITGGGGGYKSIKANGNIVSTNAGQLEVGFMHANNITTKPGGIFHEVKVNNDYTLGNAGDNYRVFGTLTGGGDFYVDSKDHLPVVTGAGVIAGMVRIGDPGAENSTGGVAYTDSVSNLLTNQLGTHPGLPGLPKCEVKVTAFDVNDMIEQANYIFYFDANSKHPMLRVQNVSDRDGNPIDQVFDLKRNNIQTFKGYDFFKCGWGSGDCVSQWGRMNPNDGWYFNGLHSFPSGIVVFGGVGTPEDEDLDATQFTLDGIADSPSLGKDPMYNTLLSTGTIKLTQGGGLKKITAPYFAQAEDVCNRDFYPTQLCQKKEDGSGFEFKTTVNDEGKATKSHPLANNAIVVNKNLDIGGWALTGHVVVGEELTNHSNETTIEGGLMVGLNLSEDEPEGESMVTAGGLVANIDGLAAEQLLTGIEGTATGAGGGTGGTQRTLSGYQVAPL